MSSLSCRLWLISIKMIFFFKYYIFKISLWSISDKFLRFSYERRSCNLWYISPVRFVITVDRRDTFALMSVLSYVVEVMTLNILSSYSWIDVRNVHSSNSIVRELVRVILNVFNRSWSLFKFPTLSFFLFWVVLSTLKQIFRSIKYISICSFSMNRNYLIFF